MKKSFYLKILTIHHWVIKMETIKLNTDEINIFNSFIEELEKQLNPVPFIIIYINNLRHINSVKIISIINLMKSDLKLANTLHINSQRFAFILDMAAKYVLLKRSFLMYFQLFLQLVALFLVWKILCII